MTIQANSPEEYIAKVTDDRREYFSKLRNVILENLPDGFEETLTYGMIGYVVPHSKYPAGYHCDPKQPLPFMSIASQKNFIAFYHSGIYAIKEIHNWFVSEYPKHSKRKLDMGKSCVRFKKSEEIPFELIAELVRKIDPDKWIEVYEKNLKK
jgi:hypothetical protein